MRNIERRADFVVAVSFAILRQFGLELYPGNGEEVADGVLIFVGVEAAETGAAAFGDNRLLVCRECAGEALDKLSERPAGPGMPAGGISPAETRS